LSTIQDVALAAGVSAATVSRVINDSPRVSERTRGIVVEAIKRLDYKPNLLGRNLRRSETKLVLVLLPSIANPFYSRIVKGIEDVGHKNGYNVMLCNTNSDVTRERIYLELLKNRLADGVIIMAPEMGENELSEIGLTYPVVQCCEYKEGARVSHVSVDNLAAANKAVKHLISQGHKRIGIISCANSFVSTIKREEGYRKALQDAGLHMDEELVKRGDYSFKSGVRAASQLLALKERPTAIFAISDIMAIGAIRAAGENGLLVPQNVAIVGFDNIEFASMINPMLTTISQPKYDIGCTTMELLLSQIRGELKEPKDVFLENELIMRESTVN
jgi:LacI family repressor for deo operon, udp, cdd, tsx, nupC, and nupG